MFGVGSELSRRTAVLSLVLALVSAGCGGATVTPTVTPETTETSAPTASKLPGPTAQVSDQPSVDIPQPPVAAAPPAGAPDEQAAALAGTLLAGGPETLGPLLTAYTLSGIPIAGPAGRIGGSEGDDPVGPAWWQVWLSATGNPKVGIPLSDVGRLIAAADQSGALDGAQLSAALLADLRTMADSDDGHKRFHAHLIRQLSLQRAGGTDLLDPTATPQDVFLGSIGIQLLAAALIRSYVQALARNEPGARWGGLMVAAIGPVGVPFAEPPTAENPASPCNPTGTGEQASYWTQWVISKLAGGLQLPGMENALPSTIQLVMKNADLAKSLTNAVGWLSALIGALSFLLQLMSLEADVHLDPPLPKRTKSAAHDGEQITVTAYIEYDLDDSAFDGGDDSIVNCLLLNLNLLGIQANLNANGAVAEAEVVFEGRQGFGQALNTKGAFVQFPNGASQMKQTTGEDGRATIDVEGIHQKRQIPEDAKQNPREFSIAISSTAEAINARSIANTFIDSILAVSAGGSNLAAPPIDILKTLHWDLGEYVFPIIDWQVPDYKIENVLPGVGSFTTTKCDGREGAWRIEITAPQSAGGFYEFTFPPSSNQASVHADYVLEQGEVKSHWVLDGQVTFVDGDPPKLTFGPLQGNVTVTVQGTTLTVPNSAVAQTVELQTGDFCPDQDH